MTHLNGIDVRFVVLGQARSGQAPVLYITGSGHTLDKPDPVLSLLADHGLVATYDKRGLGASSVPAGPYSMADYAADAIALVDHLGWTRFALLGVSFGGMVAAEVAVTVPDRIERLALLCTSAGGAGGSSFPLHTLAAMPADEQTVLGPRLLDSRFTPQWLTDHPRDAAFAAALAAEDAAGTGAENAERARGRAAQLQARIGHDVWERLPRVYCPTLVAYGRHDMLAPPENSRAIAAQIPGAALREYDGGHAFMRYDDTALPEIIGFLLPAGSRN